MQPPSNQSEPMVPDAISDGECVQRLQKGDTDAFEVLVRRHQKTIFNLVYRMLGDYDDAAEIAQEVFLSAYRSIAQFRGDANFSTWLYRIAINHASTRRKSLAKAKERRVPLDSTDPVDHRHPNPLDAVMQKEIRYRVQSALNTLDPDEATIILLRDLQDVPYDEVAKMLDVPVGTVKSRLHRARQTLKAKLTPFFGERNLP